MDTRLKLESPWTEVKELIMEVEPSITDKDLEYEAGKENELLQRIADKMKDFYQLLNGINIFRIFL